MILMMWNYRKLIHHCHHQLVEQNKAVFLLQGICEIKIAKIYTKSIPEKYTNWDSGCDIVNEIAIMVLTLYCSYKAYRIPRVFFAAISYVYLVIYIGLQVICKQFI